LPRMRLKCLSPANMSSLMEEVKLVESKISDAPERSANRTIPHLLRRVSSVRDAVNSNGARILVNAFTVLSPLKDKLQKFCDLDLKQLSEGNSELLKFFNRLDEKEANPSRIVHELLRFAKARVTVWWEAAAAAYISSAQEDLQALNPFLSDLQYENISLAVTGLLLRTIRLAQSNQCLIEVGKLISHIKAMFVSRVEVEIQNWNYEFHPSNALIRHVVEENLVRHVVEKTFEDSEIYSCLKDHLDFMENMLAVIADNQDSKHTTRKNAVIDIVYHMTNFDRKETEAILRDAQARNHILDSAVRKCFYKGRYLRDPEDFNRTQVLSRSSIGAMAHLLEHTAQGLVTALTAKRGYTNGNDNTLDPRFLVFEYTVGFMVRGRQIELVKSFIDADREGKSSVHQMIMGAGKTTVISPMLCMLLADGESLVTQVVPQPLLAMSRFVLPNVFCSILSKRIYTVMFDRSSPESSDITKVNKMYKKLNRARKQRDLVVTTPESVKSLMLKYIDLLQSVQAASPVLSLPDHVLGSQKDKAVALAVELKQNYETAEAIRNILELWSERKKGVALLDEVDMLLHPLRSELNFPIGEKRELDLAPLRWELPIHLLDAIFYTQLRRISLAGFKPDQESLRILKELSDKIQEGRQQKKLQLEPHLVLLQPSFYDSDLKQLFAQWALIWLKEQESIISDIQTSQASSALIENMLIFVSNQGDRSSSSGTRLSSAHTSAQNLLNF